MTPEQLRARIFESLDNSKENGYSPEECSAEYLAADMASYDSDLEDVDVKEMLPHINEWLAKHPKN